jgi:hypothetical protein
VTNRIAMTAIMPTSLNVIPRPKTVPNGSLLGVSSGHKHDFVIGTRAPQTLRS